MGVIIMKKIISVITACIICALTFTACNTTPPEAADDFSGVKFVRWGEGNRAVYDRLDDLERASTVVVVGTFLEDAVQKEEYQYNDFFGKDILTNIRSDNTIEVSKVLKGDVEVGDKLTVIQSYGVVDGQLVSISDLTPMVKGDTWLFFLKKSSRSDVFWCEGDSDGRYPVPNSKNRTLAISEYSELGVYDEQNFKSGIYSEILNKYYPTNP